MDAFFNDKIKKIVGRVAESPNLLKQMLYFAPKKQGGAVKPQDVMKNYNMMLNHLMGHIEDYNEPIDPKDYKQSKVLINSIRKLKKNKPKKKSKKN